MDERNFEKEAESLRMMKLKNVEFEGDFIHHGEGYFTDSWDDEDGKSHTIWAPASYDYYIIKNVKKYDHSKEQFIYKYELIEIYNDDESKCFCFYQVFNNLEKALKVLGQRIDNSSVIKSYCTVEELREVYELRKKIWQLDN